MNAIETMVREIIDNIPEEVLIRAFPPSHFYAERDNRSLEARIIQEVIVEKIIPDLNILGGETVRLNVERSWIRERSNGCVIEIPFSETQGRAITQAFLIDNTVAIQGFMEAAFPTNMGGTQGAIRQLSSSFNGPGVAGITRVHMNGPNTLYSNIRSNFINVTVLCQLEHDSELMNIPVRFYSRLADFALLGCKILVHSRLRLKIGEGSLNPGSFSGEFKSIIDEYADSRELYAEQRTRLMHKLAMLMDRTTRENIIRLNKFR